MTTDSSRGARVFLTGSTGFVGKVVLEELLRRREELCVERIYLLIRPRGRKSPEVRFNQYVAGSPCFSRLEPGWRRFCQPVAGDILGLGLGLPQEEADQLRGDLTHIIHCAASVRFDLPIAEAASINVTGALHVLDFAKSCAGLERLVDVSTAYVTPHPGRGTLVVQENLVELPFDAERVYETIRAGLADEKALLASTGHPNTYTFTKCLAEACLAARRGDTPLTLVRPSVVSACRRYPFPGWIDSHAAYAAFISLLGAGHLRVIRIDPATVVDLVPCDDVADRILACAFEPALQQPLVVRHAVAGWKNSGALSRLAYTHEAHFRKAPHEKKARWAYVGPSKPAFRFHELVHHRAPLSAAKVATRLRGQKKQTVRIERLAKSLSYLDEAFHYFGHHTFDFRTAFPPLEGFDLDSFLQSFSDGISEHLLERDPTQAPLRTQGMDLWWALRQPEGNATTRLLAYVIRKALRVSGAEITFNEIEIQSALRQVRHDDLVILAPSHRSYLDFLVTSLLCFAHPGLGLKLPRIAATDDFARIPIVGRLLRAAGAFYIKRGTGAPDPALTQQIAELVENGHSLEFYVEGTRSRGRRFLAPKRGMLRAIQQAGRPVVVLPLSISYDRIAEEEGFLLELEQGAKHRSGLVPLINWTRKLLRGEVKLGRIHVRAGAPLRLASDTAIKTLSHNIVAELQRHTAVTSFHIRAFCERHRKLGIESATLRAAITERGGVVIESKLNGEERVPALLQRTYDGQWMHLFYADARQRAPGNAAVTSHIRYNGFWFPETALCEHGVTDAVVDALFEPVCRDYQAVARELEAMPAGGTITSHQLVARLDGVFLADVDGALADLEARGVLASERQTFRWAEGPRDLTEYRNDCAWYGTTVHFDTMIC